jgi:hypothetical protein
MDIKEVTKWAEEVEVDIDFLRDAIQNIKLENAEKLKKLSEGVQYYKDELHGLHELQQRKTVAVTDISTYLLKQISESPKFKACVKKLQDGEDVSLNLTLKKRYRELPLELTKTGIKGEVTRNFESRDDVELQEKVEKRLKTKQRVKVSEMTGGFTYEE